jgi:hypothetical protein
MGRRIKMESLATTALVEDLCDDRRSYSERCVSFYKEDIMIAILLIN